MNDLLALGEQINKICCEKGKGTFDSYDCLELLKRYKGKDWKTAVKFGSGYTRTLVYREEEFDIWLIGWKGGQSTPIHNHPERGCLQKVLIGELVEQRFDCNTKGEFIEKKRSILKDGEIGYIKGKLGYHVLGNLGKKDAVSLHIYSPAKWKVEIMDEYNLE